MFKHFLFTRLLAIVLLIIATEACVVDTTFINDRVFIEHSPVVATSSETVTFTAKAETTSADYRIRIYVNSTLVHTCYNTPTCTYIGGPYSGSEGGTVAFLARMDLLDCENFCDKSDGYYEFGITDASYAWGSNTYIPARVSVGTSTAPSGLDEILLIHMADDYTTNSQTFADFVGDVGEKINNVYVDQSLIKENMHDMDIYVYTREASASSCGTVHWLTNTEVPWRDDDAILHYDTLSDCTDSTLTHFSAEGSSTVDFLHHTGHAVFGLADEGVGASGYFQGAQEPNIFMQESYCHAEQTAKGRDADACYNFSSSWWGIHTGTTVMSNGAGGDPGGIEATERVNYFFSTMK
jgi:hypothetical protein